MKRMIFLLTIFVTGILLAAGCTCPMAGPQIVTFKNEKIYQGQSIDSVEKSLGSPDIVSNGPYTKNMWAGGVMITPGTLTIEWVYLGNPNSLIIWIENNHVVRVCIAPTEQIRN